MSGRSLVTGRETMTSRERVAAFFKNRETDRVPINAYWNEGVQRRVMERLGAKTEIELKKALGVDFQCVAVEYTGPKLYDEIPGRKVSADRGIRTRWVEHASGGYWDFCDFPLADAGVDEVAAWPLGDPDDYDYDQVLERCQKHSDFALHVGTPGTACIINTAGMLRGMEQVFVDLATGEPAGLLLFDRLLDQMYEQERRILEIAGERISFMHIGEDLGMRNGPLISRKALHRHILPRHKRFFDLARGYNLPILMHTCGSSSWAYDDYIELGLTGVDTLQPEAKDMSPEYLKSTFGGRLVFQGSISTAGKLAFGTPGEVTEECRRTLEIMMPGGGYAFSPAHAIQDNTPTENVIAMYEAVHKYGWYS